MVKAVKRKWNGKYNMVARILRSKQRITTFEGWLLLFMGENSYPNLPQNKPHKKLVDGRWVQTGFQPNSFNIFNIKTEPDVEGCLSEMDEYRHAFAQVKKNYPRGIDVYCSN